LTLDEFKGLQKNKVAKAVFKDLVKKLRESRSRGCSTLPFEFNIMLEYLTNKMTRENIIDRINKKMADRNIEFDETANDYYLLFK
jgi:hypothetical protein